MILFPVAWGFVINTLDKPIKIKIGSNRVGFKPVFDVVRDHLSNQDVYNKYMDQLEENKTQHLFVLQSLFAYNLLSTPRVIIVVLQLSVFCSS